MMVVAERERDSASDVVPPSLDPDPPGVNGDTVRSSQQSYHPLQDPMHMPDSSPYLCSGSVDYFDCSLLRRNEATENGPHRKEGQEGAAAVGSEGAGPRMLNGGTSRFSHESYSPLPLSIGSSTSL